MDCGGCYNGLCKGNCHRPMRTAVRIDKPKRVKVIPANILWDIYGLCEVEDDNKEFKDNAGEDSK